MEESEDIIELFSPHLFWDVDKTDLNIETHRNFIIHRVIQYGKMNDWNLVKKVFGMKIIKEEIVKFRTLNKVSLAYLCLIFNMKKTDFRCYTHQQLVPNYWNS